MTRKENLLTGLRQFATLSMVVLAFSLVIQTEGHGSSGFYYDNGFGQTVIESRLDASEQTVMQEEILHLLGLNQRPHKQNRRILTPENSTVPIFMKDIYSSLLNELGDAGEIKNLTFQNLDGLKASEFRLEAPQLQAINESDIIMSFVNYGRQEKFETTRRFWFDVQEVGMDDVILGAELRIFKKAAMSTNNLPAGDKYKVTVYQLMDGSTSEEDVLDSVTVEPDQEGWILLDVSKALQFWQMLPKLNLGLLLKTELIGDGPQQVVSPHELGLLGDREMLSPHESFMVAFLKNGREVDLSQRARRHKRSSDHHPKSKSSRYSHKPSPRRQKDYSHLEDDFTTDVYSRDYYGGRHKKRGCQKRVLYVSFRDLGWEDWIIAPDGYEAFFCHGECSFPLNTHMNATNHAIVQTLVHLMKPYDVTKPSCAPTLLSEISVLYFDESSNVILKKYKNMVVKSCGCH